MPRIDCARCGNTTDGMERPPLPGELGARVAAHVCPACWKAWLETQIILINENRLSGANPEHVDYLLGQMKTFLNLGDGES